MSTSESIFLLHLDQPEFVDSAFVGVELGGGPCLDHVGAHPVVRAYTMSPTKRRNDSFSTNCL